MRSSSDIKTEIDLYQSYIPPLKSLKEAMLNFEENLNGLIEKMDKISKDIKDAGSFYGAPYDMGKTEEKVWEYKNEGIKISDVISAINNALGEITNTIETLWTQYHSAVAYEEQQRKIYYENLKKNKKVI